MATASTDAVGSEGWVIWLTYVNHCRAVNSNRLKVLILSLNQNGKRPGSGANVSPDADVAPSVYRWNLSHPKGIYAERGKPDCLHESGNRTARGGDR